MTRVERQEDAHHPVHGRPTIVSDEVERDGWRLVRRANQVQHPTDRQIIEVVRWQIAVRAVLAKAAERAIHQTRIDLAECGVIRAQTLHHSWSKPFHQYVGVGRQLLQDLLSGRLEVHAETTFIAIHVAIRCLLSLKSRHA